MDQLEFSHLLPKFAALNDIFSRDGISAAFVAFLWIVFAAFLLGAFTKYLRARRRVGFLNGITADLKQETLFEKRRDLKHATKANQECHYIWREFDESLVEDAGSLYNTLDAAHFFNVHTLSFGLAENRLFAAVPGFLTAIGVAGTFLGLQLGLGSMEDSSTTEGIKSGIATLLGGASIAFMTSVWGVTLSLLFNFFEKLMERSIRNNIAKLERRIDHLFPRLTAERSLTRIVETSTESYVVLQTLAEKIGDRLQEVMGAMTESMQETLENSLRSVLDPAIQSMVNNSNNLQTQQAEGAQQALQEVMGKFLEAFKSHGADQRGALDEAAGALTKSMENVGVQMNGVLDRFSATEKENAERAKAFEGAIQNQLQEFGDAQSEASAAMSQQVGEIIGDLEKHQTNVAQMQEEQTGQLRKQMEDAAALQADVMEQLSEKLVKQIALSSSVLEKEHEIHDALNGVINSVKSAADDMSSSAGALDSSSANIRKLGKSLEATSQLLAENIDETVKSADDLTAKIAASYETVQNIATVLEEQQNGAQQAIEDLGRTTERAREGFESMKTHQLDYIQELESQVSKLAEEMQSALNKYADQANALTENRMDEWNTHTGQYTEQMVQAIRAIANAVDEIETKVRVAAE
jgi:hypothetical protein